MKNIYFHNLYTFYIHTPSLVSTLTAHAIALGECRLASIRMEIKEYIYIFSISVTFTCAVWNFYV